MGNSTEQLEAELQQVSQQMELHSTAYRAFQAVISDTREKAQLQELMFEKLNHRKVELQKLIADKKNGEKEDA